MEINNLMTLEQFIDEMDSNLSSSYPSKWILTKQYSDILKQPLKKEMFVNLLQHKWVENDEGKEICLRDSWHDKVEEAEKKVIFDIPCDKIQIYNDYVCIDGYGRYYFNDDTLGSFAVKTGGVLKTKNLEV